MQPQPLRALDRLGLVLFHHQADVQSHRYLFHLVGNFGLAILIVTVLVKLVFFPLGDSLFGRMS